MATGDISVIYGNTPKTMVLKLLAHLKIETVIPKNALIGIKPNLVVAKPASSGATTSPELVAGVIEYLQSKGYQNIVIMEGSWVGDRTAQAFKVCGYQDLSMKYQVPLVDLQRDHSKSYQAGKMSISVCNKAMEADYLINMPVMKGHCQTNLTCALKNMKGCIPDSEKRRFHSMGLHQPIAYLNQIIKSDLIIVDSLMGDLDFEEGGNPVQMNRVFAGFDPVLIDAYAASLMGFDIEEVPYIGIAASLGVGSPELGKANIVQLNKDLAGGNPIRSRKVMRLARYIEEKGACSACYGSLIHALARLDERGSLDQLPGKVKIGQGYKGNCQGGIGVGVCTQGAAYHVSGCPPKAQDILRLLEKIE